MKILIAEDTEDSRILLEQVLESKGYEVMSAINGVEALELARKSPPDLIISDILMPEMDGFELCRHLKDDSVLKSIPVVFYTATYTDRQGEKLAMAVGASRFVIKPVEPKEFVKIVEEVLAEFKTATLTVSEASLESGDELDTMHLQTVVQKLNEKVKELEQEKEALHLSLIQTIQVIAATLEKRDPYTAGHQRGVANLAVAIATELGLDKQCIEGLRMGATIHDIGKIHTPAEILNRPGKLTDPEFMLIKNHPQVGYEILKDVDFPWPVAEMILQHHEHLDGSGYGQGLKSDDIILEARILAVADVVEAIVSHRPYRAALGIETALEEITKNKGIFYDADVVNACIELIENKGHVVN